MRLLSSCRHCYWWDPFRASGAAPASVAGDFTSTFGKAVGRVATNFMNISLTVLTKHPERFIYSG